MNLEGYLFVHFTGESEDGEQIYFSLSRDGLFYEDLNGKEPVLRSKICECGLRDPFILRSRIDNKFYIIATDLRIASKKGWHIAQYEGSKNIMIASSDDLVNWTDFESFEVGIDTAGCVWAPEAIYNEKKKNYLVFFASMVKIGEEEPKQRIYAVETTDFRNFSEPFLYIEKENHIIDTTIFYEEGYYYRFSKDETTKNIVADMGEDLLGEFTPLKMEYVNAQMGLEGPIVFKLSGKNAYILMADRFAIDGGYIPYITDDIRSGDFKPLMDTQYDMGMSKKRHGSVLNITCEEYNRLKEVYNNGRKELL